MNTLSWMIYAADVFSKLAPILGMGGFFVAVGGVAAFVIGTVPWSYYSWDGEDHRKRCEQTRSDLRKNGRLAIICAVVALILSASLPSQKTIYMIAASEAGETIVTSPEARDLFNDLKRLIQQKLRDELGDIKT